MKLARNLSIETCAYVYVAWSSTYALLLPVFFYIILVGLHKCCKPRPVSPTAAHSDVFTLNMAALEVIEVLGHGLHIAGVFSDVQNLDDNLNSMSVLGQIVLHALICSERYLAVVHPVAYLLLKKKGAVVRNTSIALTWALSLAVACANHLGSACWFIIFITSILSLVAVSFFCVSVLYALVRPPPGERAVTRGHVDQSKRRAFHTLAAITVALVLKFVTLGVTYTIELAGVLESESECLLFVCAQWLNLPSILVVPMLFLYRRDKQRKSNPQQNKELHGGRK